MCFITDHESKLDVSDLLYRPEKHLITDDHDWINRAFDELLQKQGPSPSFIIWQCWTQGQTSQHCWPSFNLLNGHVGRKVKRPNIVGRHLLDGNVGRKAKRHNIVGRHLMDSTDGRKAKRPNIVSRHLLEAWHKRDWLILLFFCIGKLAKRSNIVETKPKPIVTYSHAFPRACLSYMY